MKTPIFGLPLEGTVVAKQCALAAITKSASSPAFE